MEERNELKEKMLEKDIEVFGKCIDEIHKRFHDRFPGSMV